jgi:hypothetical protein
MKSYGRSTVSEFLGDQIVFRNLIPCDARLPRLEDLRQKLSFPENFMPRKSMPEYGAVITEMIQAAHQIYSPGKPLEHIIYFGDTRMNDGQAFLNICNASECKGVAFIGADRPGPLSIDHEILNSETLFIASRWNAIDHFETFLEKSNFTIDEQTTILFDLDKTILGARGRNDRVIDAKRLEAARDTLQDALGSNYNPKIFQNAYHELNQVEFHAFTADNQDYLVYIGLIVSSGLISLTNLMIALRAGKLSCFEDFLTYVEERKFSLPNKVREIHTSVLEHFQSGDPTPFKTFRYNEFKRTVQHMGHLADDSPLAQILAEEIVITAEIRDFANRWKAQGALLFGLSDKPDEAILPTQELITHGYLPIHQTPTHVIGEA